MSTAMVSAAQSLAELDEFFLKWRRIQAHAPAVRETPELAMQLCSFFSEWANLQHPPSPGLASRLRRFFTAWEPLRSDMAPKQAAVAEHWVGRVVDLDRLFQSLHPAIAARADERRLGSAINVWQVSGLGRDEARNSKVLAWLLDAWGTHGQGPSILAAFLDRMASGLECFPRSGDTALPYWVRVESCPLGEKESRVDIELDGDGLLLFLEVKIDALETTDQLDRYLAIGEAKSHGRAWGVVYLTPDGRLPLRYRDKGRDVALVPATWKQLAEVVSRHAARCPDSFASNLLRQFAEHIRSF